MPLARLTPLAPTLLVLALLATACTGTAPRDTPPPTPGASPYAPGPGVGGATSLAPPGPRYGSRGN